MKNFLPFTGAGLVAPWVEASFPVIRIILIILMVIVAVGIVFSILMQPAGNDGAGALTGQSSETYYSKNKKKSLEGVMKRLTVILGIAAAVIAILFFITMKIYPISL